MSKTKSEEIDPTSGDPVLAYKGPGVLGDVPARHLDGGDIARIAYVRALRKNDGEKRPNAPTQAALSSVADDLIDSGYYSRHVSAEAKSEHIEPASPAEAPEA